MQKDIYSDLWGEVILTEIGKRVYLYDRNGNRYNPNLILDTNLMIERLIEFLKEAKKIESEGYGGKKEKP